MGGQFVDATVVEVRRPRLKGDEKATVKGGGVPEGWSKAKRAQIDQDRRLQRPKPRGKPMTPNVRRGNTRRAKVRARVEHVSAAQKRRLGLVGRTVGEARAAAKLGLANLVANGLRLVWFETRPAPA